MKKNILFWALCFFLYSGGTVFAAAIDEATTKTLGREFEAPTLWDTAYHCCGAPYDEPYYHHPKRHRRPHYDDRYLPPPPPPHRGHYRGEGRHYRRHHHGYL